MKIGNAIKTWDFGMVNIFRSLNEIWRDSLSYDEWLSSSLAISAGQHIRDRIRFPLGHQIFEDVFPDFEDVFPNEG